MNWKYGWIIKVRNSHRTGVLNPSRSWEKRNLSYGLASRRVINNEQLLKPHCTSLKLLLVGCCRQVHIVLNIFLKIVKLLFLLIPPPHHHLWHPLWDIAFLLWISWQTGFLRSGTVNPKPNSQAAGPGLRICDSRRQGDPPIPPGTVCPC